MRRRLVGTSGLEPPTPTMSRWCSNQLSYVPEKAGNLPADIHPDKPAITGCGRIASGGPSGTRSRLIATSITQRRGNWLVLRCTADTESQPATLHPPGNCPRKPREHPIRWIGWRRIVPGSQSRHCGSGFRPPLLLLGVLPGESIFFAARIDNRYAAPQVLCICRIRRFRGNHA